jgi:hypothetical protein
MKESLVDYWPSEEMSVADVRSRVALLLRAHLPTDLGEISLEYACPPDLKWCYIWRLGSFLVHRSMLEGTWANDVTAHTGYEYVLVPSVPNPRVIGIMFANEHVGITSTRTSGLLHYPVRKLMYSMTHCTLCRQPEKMQIALEGNDVLGYMGVCYECWKSPGMWMWYGTYNRDEVLGRRLKPDSKRRTWVSSCSGCPLAHEPDPITDEQKKECTCFICDAIDERMDARLEYTRQKIAELGFDLAASDAQ